MCLLWIMIAALAVLKLPCCALPTFATMKRSCKDVFIYLTVSSSSLLVYTKYFRPTNTPYIYSMLKRFNVEYIWCVCRLSSSNLSILVLTLALSLPKAGLDKLNICVHWFSCTWNGSACTFVHVKLRVHKRVTVGANLYRLIYNLLIGIVFPIYFAIS